jgi:hypothetical protein
MSLVLAACGTASSGAAPGSAAAAEETEVAAPLLRDEFTTISGETIDLGSLEGQDVVLWFWSPW